MRKYEPIWIELKLRKRARITAPKPFHRRIIKAVIKEKDEDVSYKFELSEASKTSRLSISKTGSIIDFKLTETIGEEDL